MHALKRKPKRHLTEGMSDEDSDSEGGILAQRAARRQAAQLRAIEEANVSPKLLWVHIRFFHPPYRKPPTIVVVEFNLHCRHPLRLP
jgi:hypothetical protein